MRRKANVRKHLCGPFAYSAHYLFLLISNIVWKSQFVIGGLQYIHFPFSVMATIIIIMFNCYNNSCFHTRIYNHTCIHNGSRNACRHLRCHLAQVPCF